MMASVSSQAGSQAARPQPPSLPDNLNRLLERVRTDQANVNLFSDLLQAACDFLDSTKAKQSHIFCSIGRPCDFDLESCMLRSFSFRNKDNIDRWQSRIKSAIYSNCLECYKGFLRAKDHLRTVYLSSFPADKLDAFFAYLDSVEEGLALEAIDKVKGASEHASLAKLTRAEIYAVLTLVASPKAAKLEALLKQIWRSDQLSNLQELPAGLLTLCIDESALVRSYAARPMLFLKPLTPEMASLGIFAQALLRVQRRYAEHSAEADWSLLPILLNAAPSLAVPLTPTILSHVHDRHDRFSDVLRAYATLLKLRGPDTWNDSNKAQTASSDKNDDEFSTVVLSGILDNPYFTKPLFESPQSVSNPREKGLFFGWMRPHLDTLRSHGGKLFSEAIKRIANFLFERMQQGHVPIECRAVAFTEAIDIVLNHSDEANSRQVVDLYAASITQIALTTDTKSEESTRRAARDLIAQAFERDAQNLSRALVKLSSLSTNNNLKSKERTRAQRDGKSVATAEVFYNEIARQDYPMVEICSMLWKEVYNVTLPGSSKDGVSILLGALARFAVCMPPSLQTHTLKPPSTGTNAAYDAYVTRVRQSIASMLSAFKVMRHRDFRESLAVFGMDVREDEVQQLCTADAYSLLLLNLCPDPDVYRPAQDLLRQAFSTVESRADCFRILFQINHTSSLRALVDYLQQFLYATGRLIEANELAKWMVRSFADIVNVLAGSTDGLLRPGTSWTLIEDRSTLQAVALKAPTIWRLMCESVASIFKRTPAWSTLLAREEMVAWFRDVTIFASEMVDALAVFRNVVRRAAEAPARWTGKTKEDPDAEGLESAEDEMMVHALALPVESATSWLRMNDEDILRETQSFILKALDQFGIEYDLPEKSKKKMLGFIDEQMSIKDAAARHTLLTLDELADLKVRLDPNAGVIEISDEDEETNSVASDTKLAQTTSTVSATGTPASSLKRADGTASATKPSSSSAISSARPKEESDNSHWWAGVGNFGMLSMSQERRRNKLKQSKLSFAKVDPKDVIDIDKDDRSEGTAKKPITLDFTRPKAPPAPAPSAPINAYRGASARGVYSSNTSSTASRPGTSKASTGKLAQLRQELGGASRSRKPSNANVRSSESRWGRNYEDDVTVRAPAAVSSVTGALINKMPPPTTDAAKAAAARKAGGAESDSTASSSSSSDSSDEESEAKGLAALRGKVDRPRVPKVAQPQRRQIVVREDHHMERARRERADAERKRILRSPPDFSALHRSILTWDYSHDSNRPPALEGKDPEYRRIQPLFSNATDYGSVLGPLLLLECWAQFRQAKEEAEASNAPSIPLEVAGRSTVDTFVDVNVTIPPDLLPPTEFFNDTEIVRLKERVPAISGKQPKIVLAKVEAFKRHPQGHQLTLRCCLSQDRQGVSSALVNRSKWELKKLFSLTTLHREFAALMAAPYFDLFSDVIRGRVAPKVTLASDEVRKAMQGYQVNEPQARAILGSLATEGFSLIQGPPGTGKTKTICALIGAFVSNRKGPSTSVQAGLSQGKIGATKKILLCAPSNAAIDEVAKRARAGIRLADGRTIHPKVVRVGRDETINVAVKDISLENLIEQRLEGGTAFDRNAAGGSADPGALHLEIHNLKMQREQKQTELSQARANGTAALVQQLEAEIRNLSSKRLAVMSKLDEAKDKQQSQHRQREADRRRARLEILSDADVICTTLSGAGHEMLSGVSFDFETVVIDEAAQAVELSALIPLRYGCKQCIMVGDPNQLPPTVISQEAEKLGYSQSLFVRMFERSPQAVHLLSIQYRMHPEISVFPSKAFYDSKLQDGPDMAELTRQPWHKYELMRPFKFLSTKTPESPGRFHSIVNKEEANVALALYERLRTDNPGENFDYRIGVVTMYKAQVFQLKQTFQQRYGLDIVERIDFNTVDGFQGQEKDIIILSCVRSAAEPRSIGFLSDRRRLNVAVTRAKSNLFVIGNADHLRRGDPIWERLVATAEQQGAVQPITVAMLQRGDRTLAKNHAAIAQTRPSIAKAAAPATPSAAPQPKATRPPGPPPARPPPMAPRTPTTSTSYAPPPPPPVNAASAPPRRPMQGPNGVAAGKAGGEEKKRKAIVVDDPKMMPKKPRVSNESESHGQARVKAPLPSRPGNGPGATGNGRVNPSPKGTNGAPMRPPRSNGPAHELPAGKLRVPQGHSPQGVPQGVPKKLVTPTGASPRERVPIGVPNWNGIGNGSSRGLAALPRRPASPPKPSNAALNALFVKKRK